MWIFYMCTNEGIAYYKYGARPSVLSRPLTIEGEIKTVGGDTVELPKIEAEGRERVGLLGMRQQIPSPIS